MGNVIVEYLALFSFRLNTAQLNTAIINIDKLSVTIYDKQKTWNYTN
jgi:hypothetical protein